MTESISSASAVNAAIAALDAMAVQPQNEWATLRSACPVARSQTPSEQTPYHVTRWSDIDEVLRDGMTFSSSINADTVGRFMGPNMLALDGEAHRSYRALVAQAFRPSRIQMWEDALILPTVQRLIDKVAPNGRAELVGDIIRSFPAQVICGIANLPLEDGAQLLEWTHDIHRGAIEPKAATEAATAMETYLQPYVEERRAKPGDDLISDIIHADIGGDKLSDAQIYGFLRLLLPAGSESTFRAIANVMATLVTKPQLLSSVLAERSLLPPVIEETLRLMPSLSLVSRVTTRDTVLGGCPLPAGAPLRVFIASANLDEAKFDRAGEFEPSRSANRHLTFGTGQHQCLGMHLARLEMRKSVNAMLDGLPGLRADPDYPPPEIEGFAFRGPPVLYVRFDAR